MKTNDFSYYLQKFLSSYLPNEKGVSNNTLASYRDTFILLIRYIDNEYRIKANKINIEIITKDKIENFLNYLENERNNSIVTRNNRLAAIHSFFLFLQYEYPDYSHEYTKIISIPFKKSKKTVISFMSVEALKILFNQFDTSIKKEFRNYFMIYLMYESGVRVSELVIIKAKDFHREKPYYIKVLGKGNKERIIPLNEIVINKLEKYLSLFHINEKDDGRYLFTNTRKEILTRAGISYILDHYVQKARKGNPNLFPDKVTPHVLRHSKAVHLLQNNVNLVYIRDFLGHTSIQTTEIYAKADSKMKYEAITSAYTDLIPKEEALWHNDEIMNFLKEFIK